MGQHVDGDDYTYPIDGLILRRGTATSGGYVRTDRDHRQARSSGQRIAALERGGREHVCVRILIARIERA